VLYDAFQSDPSAAPTPATVFGTLTPLAPIPSGQTQAVIPIHGPRRSSSIPVAAR
jgi:hypothetical protein